MVNKKLLHINLSTELILVICIVLIGSFITILNPSFLTVSNFLDIIRSSLITGMFGIGAMLVIISGGIDISFPAIAAFAMYSTTIIFNKIGYDGSIFLPYVIAGLIGVGLGSINGFIIHRFKLPTLIATIGTQNLFSGILLTFIGSSAIMVLPSGFVRFARASIITVEQGSVVSSLPLAAIILLILVLFTWFILRFTVLGKGIYAIGGNAVSAERVGFNIGLIHLFIYAFTGFTAGIGGLTYTALMRTSNPFDVLGTELNVIAAVVLGGVRVTGGYGSVLGMLLGVFLITMINNSLILIGVSTYWQRFVLGLLILVGAGFTIFTARRKDIATKEGAE